MKKLELILLILFFSSRVFYAQEEEIITVIGDSLKGKNLNGEIIREVFGHVVLTQGDVKITCNRAVQFISQNNAELIGNVIVTQDSMIITTERGFYYGNEKRAESNVGVTLNDQKVILIADTGEYFFKDDKAFFKHNVKLYDTTTTLTSDKLTYYKNENRAVAVGNVKIVDPENKIFADSLVHFRESRITFASDNVQIKSLTNNTIILGDHLEDYAQKFYTIVDKNPLLIQVDTTTIQDSLLSGNEKKIRFDTLIIKAQVMEAFRDTVNIFKAKDSVKIVRGSFASNNDFTIYYRDEQKILTKSVSENEPILWYQNSQLSGDSVLIFLRNNQIKLLEVNNNAFVLSQDSLYKNRFDQISGDRLLIYFDNGEIIKTEVFGKVHSIYYLYEDNLPNGLIKSSSQSAAIKFENKKVSEVRLYGIPNSEYHPENQVQGKELSFTLPEYVLHKNRPVKEKLLKGIKIKKSERRESEIDITK